MVASTGKNETVGTMKEVRVRTSETAEIESRFAIVTVNDAGHFVSAPNIRTKGEVESNSNIGSCHKIVPTLRWT